jgi:hypothetical protein
MCRRWADDGLACTANEVHEAMSRKNRNALADRVVRAAKAALAAQGYVSPVDVLVGIGWLDARAVEHWRRGQIDCLERAVQTNLPRISEAMKLLRSWATERNLSALRAFDKQKREPGLFEPWAGSALKTIQQNHFARVPPRDFR